jgi:hypothetical protein
VHIPARIAETRFEIGRMRNDRSEGVDEAFQVSGGVTGVGDFGV